MSKKKGSGDPRILGKKVVGCEMSDIVLAYKLLHAIDLPEMDRKLVLTGVDYVVGKEKKTMLKQMTASLKKFVGRGALEVSDQAVKVEEPVYMTKADMEKVFLSKGWEKSKKGGGRQRIRSSSAPENPGDKGGYKGRKNPLGSDFKPLKCYKCQCNHTEK